MYIASNSFSILTGAIAFAVSLYVSRFFALLFLNTATVELLHVRELSLAQSSLDLLSQVTSSLRTMTYLTFLKVTIPKAFANLLLTMMINGPLIAVRAGEFLLACCSTTTKCKS